MSRKCRSLREEEEEHLTHRMKNSSLFSIGGMRRENYGGEDGGKNPKIVSRETDSGTIG
jgi:hypothetical protein